MAGPYIPNLLSSRNPRATGRGRGRGDPVQANEPNPREPNAEKDKIIQRTDQDASVSRLSAIEAGYLDDPFAHEFITSQVQRRFPIINRGKSTRSLSPSTSLPYLTSRAQGTYVRTIAIDRLVDTFLLSSSPSSPRQIISLGAGSDTRYFRLMSQTQTPIRPNNLIYHELDFPANTRQKIASIQKSPALTQCIGTPVSISPDETELDGPNYHIHALDLRSLYPPDASKPPPTTLKHIDPTIPTILISECCLIYLPPDAASNVLAHFTALFPSPTAALGLILYEPIRPHTAFGKVMVSNLQTRGIVLQTLQKYGELGLQRERLRDHGFVTGQGVVDVGWLWKNWVGTEEKERVGAVEMLDEVEEWELLAAHYCVGWGWRGEGEVWEAWEALERE